MNNFDSGRKLPPAHVVVFGVSLAGTALYLVPALALDGRFVDALVALGVLIGIAAAWLLVRRGAAHQSERRLEQARREDLLRSLLEHGSEAHVVLHEDGETRYASPNIASVVGIEPHEVEDGGRLLDLIHDHDRRRVLRGFAQVRRQPGLSAHFEVAGRLPGGEELCCEIRLANLVDAPSVGGLLVTIRDITPRKTLESEVQHLAYYDALTGLANRRFFLEQGRKALALARRHGSLAAVFYVDLDRFKEINDSLGADQGDTLLEGVAAGLKRSVRDTDIVARLGGDEFAVVLTEVRDEEAAGRVAHRILDNMPSLMGDGEPAIHIGASLGVALYPADADDVESLLKAADLAMYRAKAEATGVQFYRPELRSQLQEQLRLEKDLKRGLERHEFHLHYQPVFNLMTGQMAGAEALSRWRHFARGMVAPAEFIDLAERSGLIRSLDRWAIGRAVHQRSSQLNGRWVGWVAVNLSAHSLTDPTLPAFISEVLESARLEPGSLVLELPETAVMQEPSAAADLMWEIKNTGAAIAVDDFGMGSTSFAELKRLPIDILKLHRDFVSGIGAGDGDEHLVEATISIAHGIRAKVLAKGVERDEQLYWLRDAGCDFIQGYLMGAPVPAGDLNPERPQEQQA